MGIIRPDRREKFSLFQVGINNYPTSPLRGCVNDVLHLDDMLAAAKWKPTNAYRLFDGGATQAMIRTGMRWLMQQRTQTLIFQYSGHGTILRDQSGDEPSGIDGALCPVDYAAGRYILDDELGAMAEMLAPGQRLILLLDCCYSGASQRGGAIGMIRNLFNWRTRKRFVRTEAVIPGDAEYDARKKVTFNDSDSILIATAQPNELCDDAWIAGQYRGAGTYALMLAWSKLGLKASYEDVMALANTWLGDNGHTHRVMFGGKKERYSGRFLT